MFVRRTLPLLALAACQAETAPEVAADAALTGSGGSTTLVLDVTDVIPGASMTFTVTGADADTRVYIGGSLSTGSGPCPSALGGACLDLDGNITVLASGKSDGSGTFTRTITAPSSLSTGITLYFQAAMPGSPGAVSDLVTSVTTDGSTTWEGTLEDTITDCYEETFLDVSLVDGPGSGYASPSLSVSCSSDTMSITSNGIPSYAFVQVSPFDLVEDVQTYEVPLTTTWSSTPTYYSSNGTVGVSVDGNRITVPSESSFLSYGDPVYESVLDFCLGHTNSQGYHLHGIDSTCYFSADDGSQASPIIGWILDGYPLYGPYDCTDASCTSVVEMKSSYAIVGDPGECAYYAYEFQGDSDEESDGDEYLDECNGHYGPDGDYHYHQTWDYPYTVGCYRGTPSSEASTRGPGWGAYESVCSTGTYSP